MSVEVVSVEQAGEILGCKRSKVFELLAEGKLKRAPRFGRSLRIFRDSVDRLLRPTSKPRRATRHRAPETFDEVLRSIR